jgi:hypothetical protein
MSIAFGTLVELSYTPSGMAGRVECPANIHPAPGQYLLASTPDPTEALPVPLFLAGLPQGEALPVAPPLPAHWSAGAPLTLRGPLGKGFTLPATARRLALASWQTPPELLYPLCELGLRSGASIAFYAAQPPERLPAEVEILPLELLPEGLAWADYLAAALPSDSLTEFRSRAGIGLYGRFRIPAQGLITGPMPCGGLAECGVCALPTRKGWLHACSDGPVFDLNDLETP